MLDMIYFFLMVYIFKTSKCGNYRKFIVNFTSVYGVLVGILGFLKSFFDFSDNLIIIGFLNALLVIISIFLKPLSKHLVNLHQLEIEELDCQYRDEFESAQSSIFRSSDSNCNKSDFKRP